MIINSKYTHNQLKSHDLEKNIFRKFNLCSQCIFRNLEIYHEMKYLKFMKISCSADNEKYDIMEIHECSTKISYSDVCSGWYFGTFALFVIRVDKKKWSDNMHNQFIRSLFIIEIKSADEKI